MEAMYEALADRVRSKWAEVQSDGKSRLLIAVAGSPGSGKTTVTQKVVDIISQSPSGPSIVAIPADGFHLSRETLRNLPNADEALARRGAPWTFDGAGVARLPEDLRRAAGRETVHAPTFDHQIKDPVPKGLAVGPDVQVCILEGNYVLSDESPWSAISGVVDDRWLIRVGRDLAKQRVAARHVRAGIETNMRDALARAETNDLVNGDYVMHHSWGRFDLLVDSLEEMAAVNR